MFGFCKKTPQTLFDLELLSFSKKDSLTLGDVCEGVHIFGGTGSGKTSGSGKALAMEFLSVGMGGLVLTAKPDELATWQRYMRDAGREKDLIIFDPDHSYRFNFLDYECNRQGEGGGQTENIVSLFMTVMNATGNSSSGGDPYWSNAAKELLRNAIDLCKTATGSIKLRDVVDIINTAPRSPIEAANELFTQGVCYKFLQSASHRLKLGELSEIQENDFKQTMQYWVKTFPEFGAGQRAGVVSMFTSMADVLLRGELYKLLCTDTTITPEDTFNGKVIIINLPVKKWNELGLYTQLIFKLLWQQAIERRKVTSQTLPSFLWADEAHLFLTEYDQEFLTTARSSRAVTVFLSQNMPNYLAKLGSNSKSHVDSLLGNFQTKIFHQNSDSVTNQWASDLIGKSLQSRSSFGSSSNENEGGGSTGTSFNISQNIDFDIQPTTFTTLRKGGIANNLQVDAVIFQGGRIWHSTGKNYLHTFFNQV